MFRIFPSFVLENVWKHSGIVPDNFRTMSGIFSETIRNKFRKHSRKFPEQIRTMSDPMIIKFPGHFRGISKNCPGSFPGMSRTFPGHSRTFLGLETSWKFPRTVPEVSSYFPGNFIRHFPDAFQPFPRHVVENGRRH